MILIPLRELLPARDCFTPVNNYPILPPTRETIRLPPTSAVMSDDDSDQDPFLECLDNLGFNTSTAKVIVKNGFTSLAGLLNVSEEGIGELARNIMKANSSNRNIAMPFLSVEKLKALRHWTEARLRTDFPLEPADFTDDVAERELERMRQEAQMEKDLKQSEPAKPDKLTTLTAWEKFWEGWTTYTEQIRGAARTTLSYIHREVAIPTEEMRTKDYPTEDERLVALTTLSGDHYDIDNKRYYNAFKSLVSDGQGWSYIKNYDKAKDGRSAVLALKSQCEGPAANLLKNCLLYTSPSPRDLSTSRMPSSA